MTSNRPQIESNMKPAYVHVVAGFVKSHGVARGGLGGDVRDLLQLEVVVGEYFFGEDPVSYNASTLNSRCTSYKGASIKYVRKIFGILDPLPPLSAKSLNLLY